MSKDNCANDVTDARRARPRGKRMTGLRPPVRGKIGSLIEVEIVDGKPRQGVVLAVGGPKWGTPWYEVLFNDGERSLVKTTRVKVINHRRRKKKG